MLITDSTAENGVRRGPKYLRKLLSCIDEETGIFDYNSYLVSGGFLIIPKDHTAKLTQIERNAIYLLWRLDIVVRSYRPVWDWVVERNGWSLTGIDLKRSTTRSLRLSHSDLKYGRINDAAKRTITHLSAVVFKEFNPSKHLKWNKSDDATPPLIINIRPSDKGDSYALSRNQIDNLFSVATEILVAANDQVAVKYLLEKKSVIPSPAIIEDIISSAIDQGEMEDANRYVAMLERADPHNPKTVQFKKKIDRATRISVLARSTGRSFEEIQVMTGTDFEDLVIRIFRSAGYVTESTPRSGDYGADAIIETRSGTRIVVQCKRYKARLNLKAVQEVISAMSHYSADFGIVITTSGYLKSAVELAKSADIELWGQDEVIDFLAGELTFSSLPNL